MTTPDDLSTSEKLVKRDVDALNQNAEELQDLRKRFKKEFPEGLRSFRNGLIRPLTSDFTSEVLTFIQSELTQAKREMAEGMIEYIENHNLSNPIDKMIIEILTRDLRQSFLTDNNKKDE